VFPQRGALPSKMLLWSSVRSPLFRFGYSALFPVEKKAFPLQWRLASSTCIYADICGRKDKHKWSSTRRFSCSVSPMTCVNLACVILLHLIRSFITAAASWHGTQIARFLTPSCSMLSPLCLISSSDQVRSRSQASPKTVGVLPPTSTCNCPLHFSIGSKRDLRFWYAIGSALSTSSSMLTLKKQGTCKTCCENGIVKREQLLLT